MVSNELNNAITTT